jgi:hypothetical protein
MLIVIKLNQAEYSYLCKASFLPDRLRQLFFLTKREENAYKLNITEDQADEIRDLCGEQLQLVGFDEKYDLTPEGEMLENLVDKFYIG